jgi:hypothetical protein
MNEGLDLSKVPECVSRQAGREVTRDSQEHLCSQRKVESLVLDGSEPDHSFVSVIKLLAEWFIEISRVFRRSCFAGGDFP